MEYQKQIYLDNGKSYKNCQLSLICARLGIKLTHTHPYDPESKGKVERCFKTIKEGWMILGIGILLGV